MFIYVKMDAEGNETAPVIAFLRLHEDYEMFTENVVKKCHDQHKSSSLKRKKDRYGISDL